MKQNVDLHALRFRREPPVLGTQLLAQITGAVLLSLALLYGYAVWRSGRMESRIQDLRLQREAETTRIVELTSLYPPNPIDSALEAEVADLTRERDAKTRLLQLLATQEIGNSKGFSEQAAGLARRRVDGLWLRSVRFRAGGQDISLAGSALDPDLVPRFLQSLGEEDVFAGRAFRSLRIERAEDDPGRLDFALRTRLEDSP